MKQIDQEKILDSDFQIHEIDRFTSLGRDTCRRVRYHRILVLYHGSSQVTIDGDSIAIQDCQVILIVKGQIVSFAKNAVLAGYEIIFTDSFWEKAPQSASNCKSVLFDQQSKNQALPLTPDELAELKPLLQAMFTDFKKSNYTNKPDALAAYLKILMIKIANINYGLQERYSGYDKDIYLSFQNLISLQYKQSREVAGYLRQLNVSAKQLYEICYKQAGMSPKKLISCKVMEESKRLLQFSAMAIKEIAFDLNFTSGDQFSHFFKKHWGISPQKYRSAKENFDI